MKKGSVSPWTVFFLLTALVLIAMGIILSIHAFGGVDQTLWYRSGTQEMVDSVREMTISMMIYGNMVVIGIGILAITALHLLRRTARIQREADALRVKNEEIQRLNRQLQQLSHHQRLETIGRLTASIAHEFNNLLTPIMGYSLMALEKLPPEEEELSDNLVEIYESSRKAKEIISRLSDLSRKNTENYFREVSVDELVRRTLAVAKPAKPEEVELRLDLNCWDQRIQANEIQLSQLLLNLVLNGFHAMECGGALTVRTSFDEKWVHLTIQDTGCGIRQEDLPHIFEPFFTTKEAGKGTGLGLAIVAQVVEDHKGKITVDSAPGRGTTFRVKLPR